MTATCGQCEGVYVDTPDGRRRHQMLNGHAARCAMQPEIAPKKARTRPCSTGKHSECGGGLLHNGIASECVCSCHAGDWERAS